ncbi:MAG TPA: GNAT family N-acetyltransferase [Bacteroidales bacterium]|nr:GNAT family N-acetyltransferase [Bacteroidales bacterium]
MNYRIDIFKHQDIPGDKWNELVESSRSATPFSLYQYNSVFADDDPFYIVVTDPVSDLWQAGISARIKGRLPVAGNLFASVVSETSALVRTDSGIKGQKLKEILYKELISYSKKIGAMQVLLNHWSREEEKETLVSAGFITSANPTFEINTGRPYNEIFANYSDTCRNKVRKAKKNNVKIEIRSGDISTERTEIIESLSKSTFRRAYQRNTEVTMQIKRAEFYRSLFRNMPENATLGFASAGTGGPVSFAVVLTGGNRSIYYRGGSDIEGNRRTAASNLLIDAFIESTARKGISLFDMGGVPMDPAENNPAYGLLKFKESFGGDYKIYYSGIFICSKNKAIFFNNFINNRLFMQIYNRFKPVS